MASGLSKIEIITNFTKFAELQSELGHLGVRGMTVSQVLGCGIQKGSAEYAIEENDTVFDLLMRVTASNGILLLSFLLN